VTDDDWLKVVVAERPRLGLADDVRQRFPNAVDVVVDDPNVRRDGSSEPTARARQGSTPRQLFAAYLEERSALDPKVLALFDRLLDEAVADADRPVPA
jgi:exonuclease SbcD